MTDQTNLSRLDQLAGIASHEARIPISVAPSGQHFEVTIGNFSSGPLTFDHAWLTIAGAEIGACTYRNVNGEDA